MTDERGNWVKYGIDAQGQTTWIQDERQAAQGKRTEFTYSPPPPGNINVPTDLIKVTDSRGFETNIQRLGTGQVTKVMDGTSETVFEATYNTYGQPTTIKREGAETTCTYNASDQLSQLNTPDGIYKLWYNAKHPNRLSKVEDPLLRSTEVFYDNWGRVTDVKRPDGKYLETSYDAVSRVTKIEDALDHATTFQYDAVGNLTQKIVSGITTLYEYDDLDQLTKETYNGAATTYTYDANGNRTSRNGVVATYDDADRLIAFGAKNYLYDLAGRRTADRTGTTVDRAYAWSEDDRLIAAGSSTAVFNGLGAWVKLGSNVVLRDGAGVADPVLKLGTTEYVPGVSQRAGGVTRFAHTDWMDALSRLTDGTTGMVTDSVRYDAWGRLVQRTGTSEIVMGWNRDWGYQAGSSGLIQLGHRVYDSETGVFLSRDPIRSGRNWYAYCSGNPNKWVDPLGLQSLDSVRAYILNLWKTAKDPKTILNELDDLLNNGMLSQARTKVVSKAREFYQKMADEWDDVQRVLEHVRNKNAAPKNLSGGRRFDNSQGKLPRRGEYREWDIYPAGPKGRRPERIVTDQKGRAWYTPNHYEDLFSLP